MSGRTKLAPKRRAEAEARTRRLEQRLADRSTYEDDPDQARIKVRLTKEEIARAPRKDVKREVARRVGEELERRGLPCDTACGFVEEMPFSDGCIWSFAVLRPKVRIADLA